MQIKVMEQVTERGRQDLALKQARTLMHPPPRPHHSEIDPNQFKFDWIVDRCGPARIHRNLIEHLPHSFMPQRRGATGRRRERIVFRRTMAGARTGG